MKNMIETRNRNYFLFGITCIVFCLFSVASTAQDTTKHGRKLKNTIKLNITAPILYDNATQLGFERLIGKNQSLNVFGGYNEFPLSVGNLKLSNTEFTGTSKKSGYMFGAEYRFYLRKENKYSAPHGVYLAPYFSYYRFKGERTITYTDSLGKQSSTNTHMKINFFNFGGELGYQFVIAKRFVIDAVVFGPAVTKYNFDAKLDGSLNDYTPDETAQAIIDALKDKLPFLNDLSKNKEASGEGHETFWSVGFRYNISFGFRF